MLTTLALSTLPQGIHPDGKIPGLELQVGARRRTFSLRFRHGGKTKRKTIGHFPKMSLKEARAAAADMLERAGEDIPLTAPEPERPGAGRTLGDLVSAYEKVRRREGHRVKRFNEHIHLVRRGLDPWLALPARSFTKADLRTARDTITDGGVYPIVGNRFLSYTSSALQWAAEEDWIETNFARDVRKAPENKRQRYLANTEIRDLWKALDRMDGLGSDTDRAYAKLVRFLLLTGMRLDEARKLRHGELLGGYLTLRPERTKSNREQKLRLPKAALDLVGTGTSPRAFVFAGNRGEPVSGLSWLKRKLDRYLDFDDWTLHDLRRTMATHAREIGVDFFTVEAILGHSLRGVAGRYQLPELERQQIWADHVAKVTRSNDRDASPRQGNR
jgi:integrase